MTDPTPAALSDGSLLHTCRLQIHACGDADATALREIVAHRAVYEAFYLQGMPLDAECRIREPWGRQATPDGVTDWVARERSTGRVIGAVQVGRDNLGFFVDPAVWGRGYGREMVLACCERLPARLRLRSLQATVRRENVASRRILEHAGFAFVGTTVERRPPLGLMTLLNYRWTHDDARAEAAHW
jgi:RimJ/RimL family protein N-acetyltransferase